MKKQSLLLGASLALLVGYAASAAEPAKPAQANTYDNLQLLMEVFERVRADYVEKPADDKVLEGAIRGLVESLDPHSNYMDPEEYEQFMSQMNGEYSGLGLEVSMEDGVVKVVSPIDDSPAAKAGVLAGDYIIKIDGESIEGTTLDQAVMKMRGPADTNILLTIARKGVEKPFEVPLVRKTITVESVKWRVEREDIGYIRITQFTKRTQTGMLNAFKDLDQKLGKNLKAYILDLRSNPGGDLEQATKVADDFLERGEITSLRGRRASDTQRWNAVKGDYANGKPIIVLTNSGSASASEVVAGALQDQKRVTVLGTRSFGKGIVQTLVPLENGGALRLTTARYYTPSGRSIQAEGILPDIKVEQPLPPGFEDFQPRREEDLAGHITNEKGPKDFSTEDKRPGETMAEKRQPAPAGDAAAKTGAPAPTTKTAPGQPEDVQLNYALDLLQGKKPWPKPEAKVADAKK